MKFIIVFAAILAVTAAAPHPDLLSGITAAVNGVGASLGTVIGAVAGVVTTLVGGVLVAATTLVAGAVVALAGVAVGVVVISNNVAGILIAGITYTLASILAGGRCTIEAACCGVVITADHIVNGCKYVVITNAGHLVGVPSQVLLCIQESITDFLNGLVITAKDYPMWQQCYCIVNNCLHQLRLMCNSLEDVCNTANRDVSTFDITAQLNFLAFVNAPVNGQTTISVDLALAVHGFVMAHVNAIQPIMDGILAVAGHTDCTPWFKNH